MERIRLVRTIVTKIPKHSDNINIFAYKVIISYILLHISTGEWFFELGLTTKPLFYQIFTVVSVTSTAMSEEWLYGLLRSSCITARTFDENGRMTRRRMQMKTVRIREKIKKFLATAHATQLKSWSTSTAP